MTSRGGDGPPLETSPVGAFVRAHLPAPPGTVLDVGAGAGELAGELAEAGYEVTAIDPHPRGGRVRRTTLERFEPDELFAAVVAVRCLHHLDDIGPAVAKIGRLLRPGGCVVVQGFAWDRVDLSTTTWLQGEMTRRGDDVPRDPISFYERWRHEHKDLVPADRVLAALDNVTERVHFAWTPSLAESYLDGEEEALRRERAAVADGRIRAAGFRYVGRTAGPAGTA